MEIHITYWYVLHVHIHVLHIHVRIHLCSTHYPAVTQAGHSPVRAQLCQKRPWNPLGTSWSIKPRQHNGPTATTSPARRWSEGTIPCSAQYSLNHTWNNVPGFGPLNGRKMLTNFKDVNESEARDLWAELKAAEVEEGGKSAHTEWAE